MSDCSIDSYHQRHEFGGLRRLEGGRREEEREREGREGEGRKRERGRGGRERRKIIIP